MVEKRLKYLGVNEIYMGAGTKMDCFQDYLYKTNVDPSQILYMGDDLPDYPVMKEVGIATCPKNAATEILGISDYISHLDGGKGCVRDVIEQTMRMQDKWFIAD